MSRFISPSEGLRVGFARAQLVAVFAGALGACSGGSKATGSAGAAGDSSVSGGSTSGGSPSVTAGSSGESVAAGFSAGGSNAGGSLGSGAVGGDTASGGFGAVSGDDAGSGGGSGVSSGGASSNGGAVGLGGAAGSYGGASLLVPSRGALLGAFVGTGTFAQLETLLGRSLAIKHTFVGWNDDYSSAVQSDLAAGYVPLITWEEWTGGSVGVPLDDIISGSYDSMIQTRATAAKNIGKKFFLRWGHEMNGNWYPWSGFNNGAGASASTKYIAAYRHVHDVFTQVGASNVLWVFCPNVDSVPGDAWNTWSNYYPGDAYVDWLGFDGYNWGTVQSTSTWQSFASIAGRIYPALAAKGKPIMIPETASAEVGGDKAAWINAILPTLQSSMPQIKAFLWFDMNKETDWRVDSSPGASAAFVSLAKNAYFNP